jgi:hypothetical protein
MKEGRKERPEVHNQGKEGIQEERKVGRDEGR